MSQQRQYDISLLYVEDDDTTRGEVSRFLERRIQHLFLAENGSAGLDIYRQHRPDLVISDIMMPVMDGLRMAGEIRATGDDVHIIFTTAYSDLSCMLEAIELGIDQYVIKPISFQQLLKAIDKCAVIIEQRKAAKRYTEEREKLIVELKTALDKVKQLSGLLPICASCKKIRNDEGYWEQIESYIRDHSEAEFTHSICAECSERLYGDFLRNINKDDGG